MVFSDSPNASSNSPQAKQEPSITEIMKSPSKVVLLRVSYFYNIVTEKVIIGRTFHFII